MINRFRKVLFFADGAKGEQAALQQAARIAAVNGAKLTVMSVVTSVSTDDPKLSTSIRKLQNVLVRERSDALSALIARLDNPASGPASAGGDSKRNDAGKRIAPVKRVVVPGKDYVEVIRAVVRDGFDLLVKSANSGSRVGSALFGNVDRRLLHYCPCPVLILKPSRRRRIRNVLAAVDPVTQDSRAKKLNDSIMDAAISLAELEMADLHVLHVAEKKLPATGNDDGTRALAAALRKESERRLERLVENYRHVPLSDYLLSGDPEKVIPKFVDDHQVDVLVMGSVVRSGISGVLVGNTAEKILDEVDCSVITLKPAGWKSPVR